MRSSQPLATVVLSFAVDSNAKLIYTSRIAKLGTELYETPISTTKPIKPPTFQKFINFKNSNNKSFRTDEGNQILFVVDEEFKDVLEHFINMKHQAEYEKLKENVEKQLRLTGSKRPLSRIDDVSDNSEVNDSNKRQKLNI